MARKEKRPYGRMTSEDDQGIMVGTREPGANPDLQPNATEIAERQGKVARERPTEFDYDTKEAGGGKSTRRA